MRELKKIMILALIVTFIVSMLFIGTSCKQEAAPAEEAAAEAEEAAPSEEEAEEEAVVEEEEAVAEEAGIKIRFLPGGAEGDTFATVVVNGANAAGELFNVDLEVVWGVGWDAESYIQQFREAVSTPGMKGVGFVNITGEDPIIPIAETAKANGVEIQYWCVDAPNVRAQFGGGYVGAQLEEQGYILGKYAVDTYGFQEGEYAIVFGAWGQPGRDIREESTARAFEDAGMIVNRIVTPPESAVNPELLIPLITAAFTDRPETKVICFPGGQNLGAASIYMNALNKEPGEIIIIGYDLSEQVIKGFEEGYIQVTSDQQPYLEGFLTVQSLYQTIMYGFSPLSYNTGAGLVTEDNWEVVATYAEMGIR